MPHPPPPPPATPLGLVQRASAYLEYVISTKARLINACMVHFVILFTLFQHYLYAGVIDGIAPDSEDPGPYDPSKFRYFAKLWIPQVEFASMFLLLWGMIMLPLTMARWLINRGAKTWLARYVPFASMLEFHIFVGAHMFLQTAFVVVLFFCWFGVQCVSFKKGEEEENFCWGVNGDGSEVEDGTFFTSEIFATGLALMGALVLIAVPAYFRSKISYELFYGLHHVFVPLYAIGVAHTLDPKGRNDFSSRMQVILWTTAPIAIYSFDRFMRNADLKEVALTSFKLTTSPRAAFLRMPMPAGFDFLVGQYVKICVPAVSSWEYHPFTIATSPRSGKIELVIRVVDGGGDGESWTERLYAHLASLNSRGDQRDVKVVLEGPYGHVMTGVFEVPNVALIASGSGIVPMLSVLRDLLLSEKYALRISNASPAVTPRPADSRAASGDVLNISTVYVPARAPAISKKREVRIESQRRLIQAKQTFYLPSPGNEGAEAAMSGVSFSHTEVTTVVGEEDGNFDAETPHVVGALQAPEHPSRRKEHLAPRALLNVMSPPVDTLAVFMDARKRLHTYWLAATCGWEFFFFSMLLGVLQILCIGLEISWSQSGLGSESFPPQYLWPYACASTSRKPPRRSARAWKSSWPGPRSRGALPSRGRTLERSSAQCAGALPGAPTPPAAAAAAAGPRASATRRWPPESRAAKCPTCLPHRSASMCAARPLWQPTCARPSSACALPTLGASP